MLWVLGFLLLLVALLIPILAIVLDSPALRRFLEARHGGGGDSGIKELASRVMALEDEVEDLHRAVEGMREESQFVQRLLENPEGRDESESSTTQND